ncbi:hypothetical protein SAMN05421820_101590 [Pedobacter steynii]|uniref:Uncharacterized protein n=1 Tax=Pedobacter steynii TaxID=430522 RepID=A0A1G9KJD2_9SPHI|nr:hypothetical protein [Pedobacter steynii]NQX38562.1 hypothetical protein [Pedobacter steynii]SDL49513.1 hypothetical protein SAMN05421820_101590 [Pedobacter steynii]
MQHSVILSLTDESKSLLATNRNVALLHALAAGREKLEFMLQGYHSREKVRRLSFEEESLEELGANEYCVQANYIVEEYSVCSAIDQVDSESMQLRISLLSEGNGIAVKGIDLPERDPDSL